MTTKPNDLIKEIALIQLKAAKDFEAINEDLKNQMSTHSNTMNELMADLDTVGSALRRTNQVLNVSIQSIAAKITKHCKETQQSYEQIIIQSIMANRDGGNTAV